jgi:hypothetical protein
MGIAGKYSWVTMAYGLGGVFACDAGGRVCFCGRSVVAVFCVLFAAWCQAGLGDDCHVSAYNLADE